MNSTLAREIKGKNALKAYAKELIAHILPQMSQYIGKKIFTADCNRSKLFVIDMGDIKPVSNEEAEKHFVRAHINYITTGYNNVVLKLSICLSGGSYDVRPATAYCQYFEREFELGKCKQTDWQILESVADLDKLIQDYELNDVINLEEEFSKIQALKKLSEQMDKIKSSIKVSAEAYKYL